MLKLDFDLVSWSNIHNVEKQHPLKKNVFNFYHDIIVHVCAIGYFIQSLNEVKMNTFFNTN
jgi:hypothetical protein